jgi:hypothetical protein
MTTCAALYSSPTTTNFFLFSKMTSAWDHETEPAFLSPNLDSKTWVQDSRLPSARQNLLLFHTKMSSLEPMIPRALLNLSTEFESYL